MESLLSLIGWVLSIITAAGNGFVIFLVAKNHRLHSSANWLVLSLAVADFGVGVAVFPSTYFCNNSESCDVRIYMAFYWFFLHSSVTNRCILTWDRYIAIVHPFKYNNFMTERRPGMVILVAWLIPLVISLSLLVGMLATNSDTAQIFFRLTGISTLDIISGAPLFYAVVRILVVARAQSHQVTAMEQQVQSNHSSNQPSETAASRRPREKHNTVWFIIARVVFFLGCYIVVNFLLFCTTFEFSCKLPQHASQAFHFTPGIELRSESFGLRVFKEGHKDGNKEGYLPRNIKCVTHGDIVKVKT